MTGDETAKVKDPQRWRRRVAMALIVLGAFLLPIAGLSVWSRNQLLNTDRYTDNIAPLASDPAIQAAVADRVSDTVVAVTDIEARAEEALPDRAKFLAAPIAAGAKNLVHDLALQFVATDEFRTLWTEVNRAAHSQIVAILEGKSTASIQRSDGQVIVSLLPIAEQVLQRLQEVVPVDLSNVSTERLNTTFVLVDSKDLDSVQSLVELFNTLTWVLAGLAIAALVAGALLTPDRRKGVQRVGVAVVISMGLLLLLYALVRDRYLANLPSTVRSPAAAAAVFDITTRFIKSGTRILLAIGVVLFVAGWLPGPSKSAVWLRGQAKAGIAGGSRKLAGGGEPGPAALWIAGHESELRAGIIGLAVLALVLWSQPTGLVVLMLSATVVVALVVVQLIGGTASSARSVDEVASPT